MPKKLYSLYKMKVIAYLLHNVEMERALKCTHCRALILILFFS